MNVLSMWFGLIVLYTVATNAPALTSALGVTGTALQHLGDPSVPLIGPRPVSKPTAVSPVPTVSHP